MARKIGAFKPVPPPDMTPPVGARADMLVAFDGHCGLCTGWVSFLIQRDKLMRMRFAPLHSTVGLELQALAPNAILVLKRQGQVLTDSRAAIEMVAALGGGWRLVVSARVLPRRVADGVLRWVSRNRHRFTGAPKPCKRKDSSTAWRFLIQ
jgi:predicted DCC family thiol-disulfide oxidoreductase YuxK